MKFKITNKIQKPKLIHKINILIHQKKRGNILFKNKKKKNKK